MVITGMVRTEYDADMDRQRVLERCGWQFFRVRGSAFYLNPESALEELWESLEDLDIHPISDGQTNQKFEDRESDNEETSSEDEKKEDNSEIRKEPTNPSNLRK